MDIRLPPTITQSVELSLNTPNKIFANRKNNLLHTGKQEVSLNVKVRYSKPHLDVAYALARGRRFNIELETLKNGDFRILKVAGKDVSKANIIV